MKKLSQILLFPSLFAIAVIGVYYNIGALINVFSFASILLGVLFTTVAVALIDDPSKLYEKNKNTKLEKMIARFSALGCLLVSILHGWVFCTISYVLIFACAYFVKGLKENKTEEA